MKKDDVVVILKGARSVEEFTQGLIGEIGVVESVYENLYPLVRSRGVVDADGEEMELFYDDSAVEVIGELGEPEVTEDEIEEFGWTDDLDDQIFGEDD